MNNSISNICLVFQLKHDFLWLAGQVEAFENDISKENLVGKIESDAQICKTEINLEIESTWNDRIFKLRIQLDI